MHNPVTATCPISAPISNLQSQEQRQNVIRTDLEKVLGPRVPADEFKEHRARYLTPTLIFAAAAILLVVSIPRPWWRLKLNAPQYPQGLFVTAYVNKMAGDVAEIDGLNHYIGMRPLAEAASSSARWR